MLRGMEMVANTGGSKGREVHQAQPKTLVLSIFYVHLSYWSLSESPLSLSIQQVVPEVLWYTRYFLELWGQTRSKTSPSPGGFSFSSSVMCISIWVSLSFLVSGSKINHKVATICHSHPPSVSSSHLGCSRCSRHSPSTEDPRD